MVSRFNGSISASGPHAAQVKQDDIASEAFSTCLALKGRAANANLFGLNLRGVGEVFNHITSVDGC